jgi:hypothetical protein
MDTSLCDTSFLKVGNLGMSMALYGRDAQGKISTLLLYLEEFKAGKFEHAERYKKVFSELLADLELIKSEGFIVRHRSITDFITILDRIRYVQFPDYIETAFRKRANKIIAMLTKLFQRHYQNESRALKGLPPTQTVMERLYQNIPHRVVVIGESMDYLNKETQKRFNQLNNSISRKDDAGNINSYAESYFYSLTLELQQEFSLEDDLEIQEVTLHDELEVIRSYPAMQSIYRQLTETYAEFFARDIRDAFEDTSLKISTGPPVIMKEVHEFEPREGKRCLSLPFISRSLTTPWSTKIKLPNRPPDQEGSYKGEYIVQSYFYDDTWSHTRVQDPQYKIWKKEAIMVFNGVPLLLPEAPLTQPFYMVGGADNQWLSISQSTDRETNCMVNVFFTRQNKNFKNYLEHIQRQYSPFLKERMDQLIALHEKYFIEEYKKPNVWLLSYDLELCVDYERTRAQFAQELNKLLNVIRILLEGSEEIKLTEHRIYEGMDGINFFYRTTIPLLLSHVVMMRRTISTKTYAGDITPLPDGFTKEFPQFGVGMLDQMFHDFKDPHIPDYRWIDLATYYEVNVHTRNLSRKIVTTDSQEEFEADMEQGKTKREQKQNGDSSHYRDEMWRMLKKTTDENAALRSSYLRFLRFVGKEKLKEKILDMAALNSEHSRYTLYAKDHGPITLTEFSDDLLAWILFSGPIPEEYAQFFHQ